MSDVYLTPDYDNDIQKNYVPPPSTQSLPEFRTDYKHLDRTLPTLTSPMQVTANK